MPCTRIVKFTMLPEPDLSWSLSWASAVGTFMYSISTQMDYKCIILMMKAEAQVMIPIIWGINEILNLYAPHCPFDLPLWLRFTCSSLHRIPYDCAIAHQRVTIKGFLRIVGVSFSFMINHHFEVAILLLLF